MKAQRGNRGIAVLFIKPRRWTGEGGGGGGCLMACPGRFTPEKVTLYPLYRRLGGPQSRSGWVRKIPPPTGLRSRGTFSPKRVAMLTTLAQRNGMWMLTGLYWLRIGPINLLPEA